MDTLTGKQINKLLYTHKMNLYPANTKEIVLIVLTKIGMNFRNMPKERSQTPRVQRHRETFWSKGKILYALCGGYTGLDIFQRTVGEGWGMDIKEHLL